MTPTEGRCLTARAATASQPSPSVLGQAGITIADSVNVTAIMQTLGIKKFEWTAGRFLVVMLDGRAGVGGNVGEAFDKASEPNAFNVRKAS